MPRGFGRGYRWIYHMTGLPRWARDPIAPPFECLYPPAFIHPYGTGQGGYGPFPPYSELTGEEEIRMLEEELSALEAEKDRLLSDIDEVRKEIEHKKKGGE